MDLEGPDSIAKRGMRRRTKVVLGVAVLTLVLGVAVVGSYFVIGSTVLAPAACTSATSNGAFGAGEGSCISMTITINHQEQRFVDLKLVSEGFKVSCLAFCSNGITYTLDPAPVITNQGHDFEECKIFQANTGLGGACAAPVSTTDIADVIGVSTSGAAPAATDAFSTAETYTAAGACDNVNIASGNGFTAAAATTLTTPAASAGSVTTTAAITFTATGGSGALDAACLLTELTSGGHPLIYAEGNFGPDTLVSGNTLTITWTITRT